MKTRRVPTKPLLRRRYLDGKCVRCCAPRPAGDDNQHCPQCRDKAKQHWMRWTEVNATVGKGTLLRRRRVAAGVCTDCTAKLHDPGVHSRCPDCRAKETARRAASKQLSNGPRRTPAAAATTPATATKQPPADPATALQQALQLYLSIAQGGHGLDFDTAIARTKVKPAALKQAIRQHNARPRHQTPYAHGRSSNFTLGIW